MGLWKGENLGSIFFSNKAEWRIETTFTKICILELLSKIIFKINRANIYKQIGTTEFSLLWKQHFLVLTRFKWEYLWKYQTFWQRASPGRLLMLLFLFSLSLSFELYKILAFFFFFPQGTPVIFWWKKTLSITWAGTQLHPHTHIVGPDFLTSSAPGFP